MKCRVCRGPAVIDVRRHNAAFCGEHFVHHCQEQTRRAIKSHSMIGPDDRVLVAVSGGKDSLALWDLLLDLGHRADGLYLGLGIGEYSSASYDAAAAYASERSLHLHTVDLSGDYGFDIPGAAAATRRAPCGSCGLSKRHLFNQVALDHGYDVVATGHNLDDEAAVLLGNVLRWDVSYLGRQFPILPAGPGFVRKVKPLYRLGERETAAYCVLRGIDYQVEECPMAEGNRHLGYKAVLNELEDRSPGSKAAFLFGFLERVHDRLAEETDGERAALQPCTTCGSPTPGEVCAFCRLQERASPGTDQPVALRTGR
jgi:tRNA-5-methyluridine54 2-sulfurtransferase